MGPEVFPVFHSYPELDVEYDEAHRTVWYHMDSRPRPCFTPPLLESIKKLHDRVIRLSRIHLEDRQPMPVRYMVLASRAEGVFSYGGDLSLFVAYIRDGNREGLRRYAKACIDVVYTNVTNLLGLPLTTMALVQGDALGGGWEAAMSSSVVVAEESAKFGLPEVLFNLFPGMGAYSILARRLTTTQAERMIRSGDVFTAREMHEVGLVDVVAPNGEGPKAVLDFIKQADRRRNARQALFRVRDRYDPVTYNELRDIAEIWVDAAMSLTDKDFRMMERLVRAQNRSRAAPEQHPAQSTA
ncbi:MAG: crotonase/enoyl-CoA hydratase family protein [Deferrisomatales bacterium]